MLGSPSIQCQHRDLNPGPAAHYGSEVAAWVSNAPWLMCKKNQPRLKGWEGGLNGARGRRKGVLTNEALQEGVNRMGLVRDEELDRSNNCAPGVWPTCRTGSNSLVRGRADPGHSQLARRQGSLPPCNTELDPPHSKRPSLVTSMLSFPLAA